MKKYICQVLCCMAFLSFALPLYLLAGEPRPEDIAARVVKTFRKAGGIEMTFSIKSDAGMSAGHICLKGGKFFLETEGIKTWFDGHTQWSYVEENGEVNISEPTPQELQTINPYALLQLYKEGYTLRLGKASLEGSRAVYELVMTATDANQDFRHIDVLVDRENYRPLKISFLMQGNDDRTTVVMSSYKDNQDYSDDMFVFDVKAYPDAEIIDLR